MKGNLKEMKTCHLHELLIKVMLNSREMTIKSKKNMKIGKIG
jgi:hypothetical protein